MTYKIIFTKKADKDINVLDSSVRKQIKKYLDKLEKAENPKAFGKQLTGNLAGYWSYRVENYRIIADVQDDKLVILIVGVGHRSIIYDELNKRFNK